MVAFVISLFLHGLMDQARVLLLLDPRRVLDGEVWRVVTYPLALGFLDLMMAAIAFGTPGEEVEGMLGSRSFVFLLLLLIVLGGMTHMLLFYGESELLYGLSNVVLFTLVGYYYLYPHGSVRIIFFSMRNWVLLGIAIIVAGVQTYLAIEGGASPVVVFGFGLFGLIFGALYFHLRYQKYGFMLGSIRSMERVIARMRVPAPRTIRGGGETRPSVQRQRTRPRATPVRNAPEPTNDEERLNQILDRINDRGYDSLSDDDRHFLDRYAKGMR